MILHTDNIYGIREAVTKIDSVVCKQQEEILELKRQLNRTNYRLMIFQFLVVMWLIIILIRSFV